MVRTYYLRYFKLFKKKLCLFLDGSLPADRIGRYCNIDGMWAESMCFGLISANEVIEKLIIDDGQAKRGNRKNVFSSELKNIGIFSGVHASMDNVIILEYTGIILKDGEMPTMNMQVEEDIPAELLERMCKKFIKLLL